MAEKLMLWEITFQKCSFLCLDLKELRIMALTANQKFDQFLKASAFWSAWMLKWLKNWCFEKMPFKNNRFCSWTEQSWETWLWTVHQKLDKFLKALAFQAAWMLKWVKNDPLRKSLPKIHIFVFGMNKAEKQGFELLTKNWTNFSKHQLIKLFGCWSGWKPDALRKCLSKIIVFLFGPNEAEKHGFELFIENLTNFSKHQLFKLLGC